MSERNQHLSEWPRLFRIACSLIDQVNQENPVIDRWTFGGGTAMMIQINHRESHDVDIFFQNPEFLQFLNPEFVTRAISELMIKDEFKNLPGSSFEDAKRLLSSV